VLYFTIYFVIHVLYFTIYFVFHVLFDVSYITTVLLEETGVLSENHQPATSY
jgi:hypothetical protein